MQGARQLFIMLLLKTTPKSSGSSKKKEAVSLSFSLLLVSFTWSRLSPCLPPIYRFLTLFLLYPFRLEHSRFQWQHCSPLRCWELLERSHGCAPSLWSWFVHLEWWTIRPDSLGNSVKSNWDAWSKSRVFPGSFFPSFICLCLFPRKWLSTRAKWTQHWKASMAEQHCTSLQFWITLNVLKFL